jgi:hypothetical protein
VPTNVTNYRSIPVEILGTGEVSTGSFDSTASATVSFETESLWRILHRPSAGSPESTVLGPCSDWVTGVINVPRADGVTAHAHDAEWGYDRASFHCDSSTYFTTASTSRI